jgi:hypothetical protein
MECSNFSTISLLPVHSISQLPSSPADLEKIFVYSVIESSAPAEEGTGASWRGGWTKAFVPSELSYENSYVYGQNMKFNKDVYQVTPGYILCLQLCTI